MKNFDEIIAELKTNNIQIIRVPKTETNTFQTFKVIGPNLDPGKTWKHWQIRAAYNRGGLYFQILEGMKKFDKRVKIGTRVVLKGYGRGWGTVNKIHPGRKWLEIDGYLGGYRPEDIVKFSNR